MTTKTRVALLATSMITGVTIVCGASSALAQAAPNTTGPASSVPSSSSGGATTVGDIVVTGSRIPQPNLTSVSPVTAVSSQELKLTGVSRVEDLINQLPQVVADQGGFLSNGATGTATISLRGLGPNRTLVLIDGRRLVPGDVADPVADINFIPAALIDRVEVDSAGASSVYGSDAVAGVVNFIMKKDFEGLQINANFGGYLNNNGNAAGQAANAAKHFNYPTGGSGLDGVSEDISIIFGAQAPDGKGAIEGYLDYRHQNAVLEAQRDYSACTLAASGSTFTCGGSSTNPNGRFMIYNQDFTKHEDLTLNDAAPGQLTPYTGAYAFNYGALNYYLREDERYAGGFFAHYDITPHAQAYAQFMFMDDHTVAQIAPSGAFGFTYNIACNNPLLSAAEVQAICTNYGYTTSNPNVVILRRLVEGGDRQDDLRHTDYRAVIGLKGEINSAWSYDVYAQFGESIYSEEYLNDVSKNRLTNALNVVTNPANGQPVCQSFLDGTDPACVPFNIWTPGGVTAAAAKYLSTPGFQEGVTTEQVVSGSITGELGKYGITSPFAKDGFGVNVGAEYRREYLSNQPDLEFQTGDLAGQGASVLPVQGSYDVKEIFSELRAPLIQDQPFAKEITFEGGYRFSHYNTAGNTNTYKLTGEWAVDDNIRFRGGFNRSVRAPNILELYTSQHLALDGSSDGCAGTTPQYTLAQCANTGVSAAQYGNIAPNPASQYNGITGGNPNLKPEAANTYTVGAVLTPTRIFPHFSLSADYFNIKISNVIQGIGADNILSQCALTGLAEFCNLVHRAPGTGSLWLGTNGYVIDTTQNLGYIKTSGIDFASSYRFSFTDFGLKDYGGVTIDFLGTYTMKYDVFNGIPGSPVLACVGKFGLTCQGTGTPLGGPLPSFKAKTRFTWATPVHGFDLSVDWRYIGPVSLDTGKTGCIDCHINEYSYFDLAASYRIKDRYTVRVGVNNIFDRDPPLIGSGELAGTVGNGNTFPQVYDPLGRYLFVNLTADF